MRMQGIVTRGHQVASGQGGDPRYPDGTLGLQLPHFKAAGLPVDGFFAGTINVDISPRRYRVRNVPIRLNAVCWTDHHPPEDFFFWECELVHRETVHAALIYMPSPETKQEHFQQDSILEILTRPISDLEYGDRVELVLADGQLESLD
ncbi:MAG: hypothetical protein AAF497_25885 [Planctomycetota bacterium]